MVVEGEGAGGLGEKGGGIEKNRGSVTNSHENVKYSTGNIVNNIAVTVPGGSWKYRGNTLEST